MGSSTFHCAVTPAVCFSLIDKVVLDRERQLPMSDQGFQNTLGSPFSNLHFNLTLFSSFLVLGSFFFVFVTSGACSPFFQVMHLQ